jgi:hypothetical protein
MSDESNRFADHEGQAAQRMEPSPALRELREHPAPYTEPLKTGPAFKRLLGAIPPSDKEILGDADHGIAAVANGNALKRSEARRDAILTVAMAIERRGQNPLTDWTTKDTDTAYAIADQLIALS